MQRASERPERALEDKARAPEGKGRAVAGAVRVAEREVYVPPMLPNWFLALPIRGDWVTALPAVPPRFRRFAPEDVHLTLIFLGACGEPAARRALECVRETVRRHPQAPFTVSLAGVVPMGPPRAYSALSALLDEGRDTATELIRRLRDVAADAAGVRRDARSPIPHVTVARPQRRATEADRQAGLAWARTFSLSEVRSTVDRVALYTWHNDRAQSLFRIVDGVSSSGD